jgi:hypothetical protein
MTFLFEQFKALRLTTKDVQALLFVSSSSEHWVQVSNSRSPMNIPQRFGMLVQRLNFKRQLV